MLGQFEGLTDLEWRLFEDIFTKGVEKRRRGTPFTPFRYVFNTLLSCGLTVKVSGDEETRTIDK